MRIDGGLEARHFSGDSIAVGLVTNLEPVDVVLEPKGYERGYDAPAPDATTVWRGDVEIRVGALADLVHSKELLRRDKDVEHLALLYRSTPSIDVEDGLDLDP